MSAPLTQTTRRSFLAAACASALTAKQERLNVVLILTDDQGYGDLGCHGNKVIRTPHLNRLHGQSTRFTHFYSSPLCSPTRASLMTGRYNYRTGIVDTWVGLAQMRPEEVTMAEALRAAGYRTALFGKWHLGDHFPMRAMDQGFEETLVFTDGAIGGIGDPAPNTYFDPVFFRNGRPEQTRGYCTDIFFSEAMRFLERKSSKPAFVYLPVNVPHGPLQVDEKYSGHYRKAGMNDSTARVYGMIENLDENVGRLLQFLKQQDLEHNTLVIFMSDNGGWGLNRYSAGLRDQKGSVYEGGIRVPFFMRLPGRLRAGVDIDRIAAHIDVLPTILELCGVKPVKAALDGRSLAPLLQGSTTNWADRTLFFQQSRPDPNGIDEPRLFTHCAARTQQYKVVMTAPDPKQTYTRAITESETELYDMSHDPGERTNIAPDHPDVVGRLRREYEAWYRDVTAPLSNPVRIPLGAPASNPVILTPQELRGPGAPAAPWNFDRARTYWKSEPDGFGYWEVEVTRNGRYELIARLGTPALPHHLRAGVAKLSCGRMNEELPIAAGIDAVRFAARLDKGPARLEAAFTGQRSDGRAISPFFLEIRYLGK
ncbi:MAG: arylsulfatase [Acidobacteria bacterium]|nr:arylsulfatase [Acidobacteriota bacterium]